jgi:hypothetical protein
MSLDTGQQKEQSMLNSNRFKTTTAVTLAAALAVSFMAVSSTTSAFAQSSHQYAPTGANRHLAHLRDGAASSRTGREAFGMAYGRGFSDSNSPAATGGGSLGYNRNLLEY